MILVAGLILRRLLAEPPANENRPAAVLEDSEQLNLSAWLVVRRRQANPDEYAQALEQAEAALRAAPDNGNILNTLGVAQYRMGRYAQALETLTKSEKLNATESGSHPDDLAFLAMARHRLGRKDEAQETLNRLREVMRNMRWLRDVDAPRFLREAEETLQEKSASETK
jgi:tetratricopeptide (TPR) repeat protein